MVSVVSGSGLGLFGASVGRGSAGVGQGVDRVYVNSTTGNLVIQSEDERLRSLGLDLALIRTYNSQGLMDDDNGDNWRLGLQQRLSGLSGSLNAAGSSITKIFGDGRSVVYGYDSARGLYVSTQGEGAHDTLSNSGGQWTWTDGTARTTETYNSAGQQLNARDSDGNTVSYGYTGDLLTRITDASGQVTTLEYTAGSRDLARIQVVSNGQTQLLTRYAYDDLHRLKQVQVDLTPQNGSDTQVFLTTYTYEGTSKRIASIRQGDGSTVSFTYEQGSDGQSRLKSYTEGTGAAARTTTFSYSASTGTSVLLNPQDDLAAVASDPLGATVLSHFVPMKNVSLAQGEWRYYAINVPAGAGELSIESLTGEGDADLYVRRGALPSLASFDAKADASAGNDELLYLQNPAAGMWYVGVYACAAVTGLELEAHAQSTAEIVLTPGEVVSEISGVSDSVRLFRFSVPPGTQNIRVALSGPNGDADLYVMENAPVNLGDPDYYCEGPTADEVIVPDTTTPGTWYVVVKGYERFSDAQLVVHLNLPQGATPPTLQPTEVYSVSAGAQVALGVTGAGQAPLSYEWEQVSGPSANFVSAGSEAIVHAPSQASDSVLRLRVRVRDGRGISTTSFVQVNVAGSGVASPPVPPPSGTWSTQITDALGHVTTQVHDAEGRLISVQGPLSRTDYTYDSDGNLTALIEAAGGSAPRITRFEYDSRGNLTLSRDAAGQTVRRTYSANNQLLTETRYRVADPDGAGAAQPAAPETTRYVYDAEDHLRFTVSAEGRVSEFQYRPDGQRMLSRTFSAASSVYALSGLTPESPLSEAQLVAWVGTQGSAHLERIDYAYDFRGQLASSTTYVSSLANGTAEPATAAKIQFVYDQRGQLLQSIDARGGAVTANASNANTAYATTYTYDGLGRLLTSTQWLSAGNLRTTRTQYDDAGYGIVTLLANGLVKTATFDTAGQLRSEVNSSGVSSLGTVSYRYDAAGRLRQRIDANGYTQHLLYDAADRQVAEVDAEGSLTEWVYDRFGQVVKTVRYADRLSSTQLASLTVNGQPSTVTLATLKAQLPGTIGRASDQVSRAVYDAAGRVVFAIDATGAVSQFFYDGAGRLTDEVRYATRVSIAASIEALGLQDVVVVSSELDRHSRTLYDADGRVRAQLDAAGFLIESLYDGAGQLIQQIGYANATTASLRANGTLEQLRPAADEETSLDAERDQRSYFFYNDRGEQVGVLDAEGYLSETLYGLAGEVSEQRRYAQVLSVSPTSTLESLKAQLSTSSAVRSTRFAYDGAGQLLQQTAYEGTVTAFTYDALGKLTATTVAKDTSDARTTQVRYDLLGRVTQELSAEGSALLPSAPAEQIESIWDRYALRYEYDAGGRRIRATARPDDQQTQTTLYCYDEDNRLRVEVNALGEVKENRYNALGQLSASIAYSNRISTSALSGGALTPALLTLLSTASDPARDAHTQYSYTLAGQRASTLSAAGGQLTSTYTAFGELACRVEKVDANRSLTTGFSYDTRGLLTRTQADPAGLNLTTQQSYDAFGRAISVTDARGNVTRTQYDRVGQVILTRDPGGAERLTSYDAFSRTRTTRDALGNVTVYSYNDTTRSSTLTTPEGIAVSTVLNRHGQTLSVTAAGNTTRYEYDANGQVKAISDTLGTLETRSYDRAGRQVTGTDARGTLTRLGYDAANRVLTQTVDDNGLALITSYVYDGQGRLTRTTEPGNRVTETLYTTDGQVAEVIIDPAGLRLRTTYQYDASGNLLTLTEGAGSLEPRVTAYRYDVLGRRTHEIIDPGAGKLNLTTTFKYDANGNVSRRIDARGFSTWFVYDANNRLIQSVDATGALTQNSYDLEGRRIASRQYASAVSAATLAGFGDAIPAVTVASSTNDRLSQTIYDTDGRERFSIDSAGAVTERSFDANGNVIRTRAYANAVAAGTYTSVSTLSSALTVAGNNLTTPSTADRLEWSAYDLRNQSVFTVDAAGAVARIERDAAGNVITTTAFATLRATTLPMDLASLTSWANQPAIATHADNRLTRRWYDAAHREVFKLDAEGTLTETRQLDAERKTTTVLYRDRPSIAAGATLAQVKANAVVTGFNAARDRVSTIERDAAARTVRVYDALTLTSATPSESYQYDAVGNRISSTDARGNTTYRTFDAVGRELTLTDALGFVTTQGYDALGNLTKLTDARGASGYTYYDTLGQVILQVDPRGYVTQLSYDTLGNVIEEKAYATALTGTYNETTSIADIESRLTPDARDRKLTRQFDTRGLVQLITYFNTPSNYTEAFQYDSFGQKTQFTNKNGAVFNYAYTARGELKKEISPQVEVVTQVLPTVQTQQLRLESVSEYSAFGERTVLREAAGTAQQRETRYFHDHAGREVRIEAPAFNVYERATNTSTLKTPVTLRTYDTAGNLIKEVGPNRGVTLNYYDSRNLLVATVSVEGVLSEFSYDEVGNRTRERIYGTRLSAVPDPSSKPTLADTDDYRELTHEFDANNRRVLTETRAETLYSIARAKDFGVGYYTASVITLARYDQNGNLTQTQDGNGSTVRHYYDAVGNKTLTVDEVGYVTYWQYNAQGQVSRESRLAGQLTKQFHEALTPTSSIASILAALPAGEDRITEFKYDALGRQIEARKLSVTYTVVEATTGLPSHITADVVTGYQYDGNGNVLVQSAADGARTDLAYDALDRKTTQLDPQFQAFNGRGQALATVRAQQLFKYDAHGNEVQQLSLGTTTAENRQVLQQFDAAGNLRERTEPGGASFSYDYDIGGNTVRTTLAVRDVRGTLHDYRTYASVDLLGREISRQDIADQGTSLQVIRETQDVRHNAYGEVEAKGVNGQFQERFIYDRLGRLFYTHEQGSPTLFLYDANGNAVLKVKGVTTDLRQVRSPGEIRTLSVLDEQFTTSLYDKRNLLLAVSDAPMTFGSLLATKPQVEGTRATPEALRDLADSLPTALTLMNRQTGADLEASKQVNLNQGAPVPGYLPVGVVPTTNAKLDPRSYNNFGISGSGEVRSPPVPTLISDDTDPAKRVVVEEIRQTLTTTTVTTEDADGNGIHDTVVKTVRTEQRLTRRTTTFTRTRNETVHEDGQTLEGEVVITTAETDVTTGTASEVIEKTTRTPTSETTTDYLHPARAETGALNLLAPVPLRINIDRNRIGPINQPLEIEEQVQIAIFVSSPVIPGYGNLPLKVIAYPAGKAPISQEFANGAAQFNAAVIGTRDDPVGIVVSKGGSTLFATSDAIDQTVQIGPFVSLKELPQGTLSASLTLLAGDAVLAGPIFSVSPPQNGSPSELVFAEPYPGAFAAGQRYEYTLYAGPNGTGAVINRVRGNIGQSNAVAQTQTTTTTFDQQVLKTRTDTGLVGRTDSAPPSQEQDNYLLNLIRAITQGTEEEHRITREQTYNAFKEVVTQKDGRGFTTDLVYDKQGNLVRQVQPDTQIYSQSGAVFTARPTTHFYYNQLSQLVGTQDANSVALSAGVPYYSTRVLVNGRVEQEFDADRKLTRHVYDRLGQERQQFDALNQETAYSYDLAGRLTRQERFETTGTLHSYDSYQYDEAGNRTAHTNALGDTETYLYDDQNRITLYTSFAGQQTRYDYTYLSALAGIGGYQKLTTTAAITGPDTRIEHTDLFGNLRYARDLGGHEFNYEYNHAGLLSRQSGTTAVAGRNAQDIRYQYYLNGLIESIDDVGISAYSKFEYDKNGNRTKEIYSRVAIVAGQQDVHPYQVAAAEYDELNRLKRAVEDGRFEIQFTYDAVGNRRSVKSGYFDLLRDRNQTQQFYYKYDTLNRFTVTLGELQNGEIVGGTSGYDITYDALSRRTSATSELRDKTTGQSTYVREKYEYDRIGTVKRVDIYNAPSEQSRVATNVRSNSALGSLLEQTQFKLEAGVQTETRKTTYTYDADQRVQSEITVTHRDSARRDHTQYTYQGDGILTSTLATTIDQNGNPISSAGTVTTTYAYEKWDSYKQSSVTVAVMGPRDWRMGTSTYAYDANGHITKLFDAQASRTIEYVNNQNGQVLRRYQIDREVNGSDQPPQVRNFYYLNGRGIGDTGTDRAEARVDYAQQLAEQETKDKKGRTSQINPQLNSRIQPVTSADFDQNFQPINDSFPAKTAGTHIVQPNETLQSIAAALYGDASLWYLIADANGITGNDQLVFGLRLTIPNVVANIRNNADTFRPYDVQAALGDTTPTLPPPPPPPRGKKGCGGLGTVLVLVVAVVAASFTAGIAGPAVAAALGGGTTAGLVGAAVAGAVFSAVSQGVAILGGLQNKFSFKDVAKGAVTSLVTAGLDKLVGLDKLEAVGTFAEKNPNTFLALRGAASSVLTQGISVATGLQKTFSWRDVAISAVAAPVAQAAGKGGAVLAGTAGVPGAATFVGRVASGIGGSLVRRAFGSKVDTATVVADAFGSALGNKAVDTLSPASLAVTAEQKAEAQQQQADYRASVSQVDLQTSLELDVLLGAKGSTDAIARVQAPILPEIDADPGIFDGKKMFTGREVPGQAKVLRDVGKRSLNDDLFDQVIVDQRSFSPYNRTIADAFDDQLIGAISDAEIVVPDSVPETGPPRNYYPGVRARLEPQDDAARLEYQRRSQATANALTGILSGPLGAIGYGGTYLVTGDPERAARNASVGGLGDVVIQGIGAAAGRGGALAAAGPSGPYVTTYQKAPLLDLSLGEAVPGFYRADPRQLRLSQSDASPNFVDRASRRVIGTIDSLVEDLGTGRVTADQVGSPLQVVFYEGKPFSIDNRRVIAFNAAGVTDVRIQVVDLRDPRVSTRFFERFDPIRGEGVSIVITNTSGRATAQTLLRDRGLIKGRQLENQRKN